MNKLVLVFAVIALFGLASATRGEAVKTLWSSWKSTHKKQYTATEEAHRFKIFQSNLVKIAKMNAKNKDVKFGINKFADLTGAEFKKLYANGGLTKKNVAPEKVVKFAVADPLPASVDWRTKGAVTPVKDQGQCGSCWSFSATGVLEGFYFIKNGKLLSFSEQQIVDCDTEENEGCNGGWHYLAVEYAAKNGLELETDYPYTARDGGCKFDAAKAVKTNNDYKFVTPKSTDQLKAALVFGPVSVAIEADQSVFQFYTAGVISAGCGADVDHAVLAVGYQKVGALEAFIVKNSWGRSWGNSGYVYISTIQQLNGGQGACGILFQPVIPI